MTAIDLETSASEARSDATLTGKRTVLEVAREAGVATSAVRFYERHGIIRAHRTSGNQRRFDDDAGCRVKMARVAQRLGLSIKEIATLLDDLPANAAPADLQVLHATLVARAEKELALIRRELNAITSGAKLCEL